VVVIESVNSDNFEICILVMNIVTVSEGCFSFSLSVNIFGTETVGLSTNFAGQK